MGSEEPELQGDTLSPKQKSGSDRDKQKIIMAATVWHIGSL